jgi:ferredoxin
MIKQLQIFYFSGTGNSKSVATWLKSRLSGKGVGVTVHLIADLLKTRNKPVSDGSPIVICYPTHGFNAPPIIYHFLRRFPTGRAPIYLINTRAGLLLGKWNIPGLSGIALLLPAIVFMLKGYHISGMRSVDLPSNWMSVHPSIREGATSILLHRWKPKVEFIADRIFLQKRTYSGFFSFPIDLLVVPIAVLYYAVGRFALAKTFYASGSCDGCELCVKNCPVEAIKMKRGRPYWTMQCESCMHCMSQCPKQAIETPHLWLIMLWTGFFIFIPIILSYFPFVSQLLALEGWKGEGLRMLLLCILSYPVVWLSYCVFHRALGIPAFRWMITQTSLTHFRFWRRYKIPRL